jgi:hypothetical protein
MSSDITVTLSFTMLLVRGLIKSNASGIIALKLTLANNKAKDLLVKLVKLLSPSINANIDKEEDEGRDSP